VHVAEGVDIGRDLPCDAEYQGDDGTRVSLETSLEELQTLPEKCEYPPCGKGVRVKEYLFPDSPPGSAGRIGK